jgi:hypothetical protein
MNMKTIVGLFDTFNQAQNAINELEKAGIPHADISLIASNASGEYDSYLNSDRPITSPENVSAGESPSATGTGATVGTVVGGVTGLLMGLGLIAIPGLGPIAAAGWFVSTLTGAGIGALTGGLLGALTHVGVPEEDAAYYHEGVRRGGTLLAVKAEENIAQSVASILDDNGAVDIDERGAEYRAGGFTYNAPDGTTTVTSERNANLTPNLNQSRTVRGARDYVYTGQTPQTFPERNAAIPDMPLDGQAVVTQRDTRGAGEKVADALTGDRVDDKTGELVR